MKKIVLNKFIFSLLAVLLFASCKDLFNADDIKKNPNAPADAPYDVLLSGTLVGLASLHEDTDVRIAYMWAGQLTGLSRQHLTIAEYQVSSSTFGWGPGSQTGSGNFYPVAANARLIQAKADELKNPWPKGIGQIIEALVMTKATTLYGDVPYSQAFDIDKYPTPVFDKQLDVYTQLLAVLDDAVANLSNPAGLFSDELVDSYDFIYHGSRPKWIAAAYTLKARLYLHLGDYAKAIESAKLGISSIAGDALIPHGTAQQVDVNLNYDFFENNRPGDTGFPPPAFLPGLMATKGGNFMRNAKTNEKALYNHYFITDGDYSPLDPNTSKGFFTDNAYQPILTFFENQLILAESYVRQGQGQYQNSIDALNSVRKELRGTGGLVKGDSSVVIYNKPVNLSYLKMGYKYDDYIEADFKPGGLANSAGSGRDEQSGLLYEIIAEKYIIMLSQYEVYNDVRRLAKATPVVQLGIQPVVPTPTGGLPQRFIYPQTEINTNPNVPKVGGLVADQWQKMTIFE